MRASTNLPTVVIAAFLLLGALGLALPAQAAGAEDGMSYEIVGDVVVVTTPDAEVGIWTVLPSAVVRAEGQLDEPGYGFIFSAILAYNVSDDGMLVLEEVPYHAPLEHMVWTLVDVSETTDAQMGEVVTVTMAADTNINKRLTMDGGNPEPGSPGVLVIEDWATVTVAFTVATGNFSSSYDVADAPEYLVNGSTEIKYDIQIDIHKAIDVDSCALDIGVVKMDDYEFAPTTDDGQYVFSGYQADEVSVSYPSVNETETDGVTLLMHQFEHRSGLKQIFEFVEDSDATAFFSWASMAAIDVSGSTSLTGLSTYYRTDGDMLRVYLTTPLDPETTVIVHDPSIGVFQTGGGGVVRLPDGTIFGSSALSLAVGLVVGLAAVAGVGTYAVMKREVDEDPLDLVRLEKNRYYRKR